MTTEARSTDDAVPELVTLEPTTAAVVRGTVAADEITDFFDRSFSVLGEAIAAQGVAPIGPAFGLYRGMPEETIDVAVGFPTDGPIEPDGSVELGELPGGRVARVVYAGGFDGLGEAWQRLGTWIAEQGLTPSESYWEVYVTEPSPDMDPADLRTELHWPVS
jgi:effector-binding domain-containing protein